jgi:hypothetical protein
MAPDLLPGQVDGPPALPERALPERAGDAGENTNGTSAGRNAGGYSGVSTGGYSIGETALGLALFSANAALNSASKALRFTGDLGGLLFSPVKRVFNTQTLEPARKGFESLVAKGETELEDWIQSGLSQESRAGEAAKTVLDPLVASVVSYLSNHPSIQVLIKNQIEVLAKESPELPQINILVRVLADNYITYLNENPDQVKQLIRSQGDVYIDHLAENPKQVQELVQGQSASMIGEITDEVRERMVTADSLLETLMRRLFRRQPRSELLPPPAEVQARALQARLPEDFPRLEAMRNPDE